MAHVLASELRASVLNFALNGGLTKTLNTDKNVWENQIVDIDSDEYDIPDTWKMTTIGNIADIKNGFTPKRTVAEFWDSKDIPWFTVDDIHSQGHEIKDTVQYISTKALGKNSTRIIKPNTVLLCCTSATIGNYAITRLPVTTNQQWNGLEIKEKYTDDVISEFILIWAMTLKNKMIAIAGSTTFPFLSTKKLADFPIPLPPIEEQARIVARVDELMAEIDEYEKVENQLVELKKNFPGDMKAAILQAALQGKMTEQLDLEGTACKELLSTKNYSKIEECYDLPESWVNAHLEDITNSIPTKQYQILESDASNDGKYPVISQSKEYSIGFTNNEEKVFKPSTKIVLFGDHTTVVKTINYPFVIGADGVKLFECTNFVLPEYLHYVLTYNASLISEVGGYSRHYKYLKNKSIPLPPIEEQRRIVEKLNQLLPLCEDIDKIA